MRLSDPVRNLFAYPTDELAALMPGADDPAWERFTLRQNTMAVHARTRTLAFRWCHDWNGTGRPLVLPLDHAAPPLRAAADAAADAVLRHYGGGQVIKLMLAELPPGAWVTPHRDAGEALTRSHRCHLPVITDPAVAFTVDGVDHYLAPGAFYEFDNTRMHAVANRSSVRRIHLMCDVLPEG